MRSPIPASHSSESANAQAASVPVSPGRKKGSLAERVGRTRGRHRNWASPNGDGQSITTLEQADTSSQAEPSDKSHNTADAESRQDKSVVSPKRNKTVALAMAHRGKFVPNETVVPVQAKEVEPTAEKTPPKSPSLHEKRKRAMARVNKSPRNFVNNTNSAASKDDRVFTAATFEAKRHAVVVLPAVTASKSPARTGTAATSTSFRARYGSVAALTSSNPSPVATPTTAAAASTSSTSAQFYQTTGSKADLYRLKKLGVEEEKKGENMYRLKKIVAVEEKKQESLDFEARQPSNNTSNGKTHNGADIEKPNKMSVSSMKARFAVTSTPIQPVVVAEPSSVHAELVVEEENKEDNVYRMKKPVATAEKKRESPDFETKKPNNNTSKGKVHDSADIGRTNNANLSIMKARYGVSSSPIKPVVVAKPARVQAEPPANRLGYYMTAKPVSEQPGEKIDPPAATASPGSTHRRSRSHGDGIILPRHKPEVEKEEPAPHQNSWESRSSASKTFSNTESRDSSQEFDHPQKQGLVASRSMEFDRPQYRNSRLKDANRAKFLGGGGHASPVWDTPPDVRHAASKPEHAKSNAVIETPDTVSVSNMKAKFSAGYSASSEMARATSAPRPRVSSSAGYLSPTKSSRNKTVDTSQQHAPTTSGRKSPVRVSDVGTKPGERSTTPVGDGRAIIETPEKVNVSSMKGKFNTQGTPSFYRKHNTPHNTPSTPPTKGRPGSDVSTPHGPTPPQRAVSNINSHSWSGRSPSPNPRFKEPPSWMKRTPPAADVGLQAKPSRSASPLPPTTQSWRHRSPSPVPVEQQNAPLLVSNEDPPAPPVKTDVSDRERPADELVDPLHYEEPTAEVIDESFVPQSPRDRPSSIPKCGKSTRPACPCSPSTRPSSIPTIVQRDTASPSRKMYDSETDLEIINSAPIPLASPRFSKERPWMQDLHVLSPRSWNNRWEDNVEEDYYQLRARVLAESDSPRKQSRPKALMDSRTIASMHDNSRKDTTAMSNDESYGEEKKTDDAALMSLTQMAANSIHAIDYEQAMSEMVKQSESYDDEDSFFSTGTGGAIPNELPLDLAHALSLKNKTTQKEKLFDATAVLNVLLVDDTTDTGIVFGDPDTYGEAGGEARAAPPRVADRAKAIANWKGGLGVAPKKINDKNTDIEEKPTLDFEIVESYSDVVFGEPATDGAAGGEVLDPSPRVTNKTHAIEEWSEGMSSTASSKSPNSNSAKPMSISESQSPVSKQELTTEAAKSSSPILRFWSSTSQDELDDAQNWVDKDPALEQMDDITPEDLEQQLMGMGGNWRTEKSVPTTRSTEAPDPFAFDAVAALNQKHSGHSSEQKSKQNTAFDPFWDTSAVPESPADFGGSTNFFAPQSRSEYAEEESFSPPTFTPKAKEESMMHHVHQRIKTIVDDLAPPSRSTSEESDEVMNRKGFSYYAKMASPSNQQQQQRSLPLSKKTKERKIVPLTTTTKERKIVPVMKMVAPRSPSLEERNLSLEEDPWSYDADEEVNVSGVSI